ncbi:kinase-like domain, phloem protein 2-like protein [Tanacetum coccineum]
MLQGKNMGHLEIPLCDIKLAIDNFADAYQIGNWEAKIADFGLSRFYPETHEANTIYTDNIAGTYIYLDPEYQNTGKLKKEVDIYSFGVVLFEIMSGKTANDPVYIKENIRGLAPVARRRFKEGTINKLVDPKIMEEVDEFNSDDHIGGGGFGMVSKTLTHANGSSSFARRLDKSQDASNGSLDNHLRHESFTWMKRLKICIDIASGLAFLHGGALTKEMVIHRDIKSANILINDDWKAKILDSI